MEGMENNNVTGTEEPGKTFTQDEVNGIVQKRLEKEREKYKKEQDTAFAEREKAITVREMRMTALEKLNKNGLSADLVDAINCSDEETIDRSIEILAKSYKSPVEGKRKPAYTPRDGDATPTDNIRQAMGLN